LYSKAIVESGAGWFTPTTLAAKEKEGVELLARIGVPATASAADLRAIPVDKLIPLDADYGPFTDGKLMTETPSQALARRTANDVPLIIGSNSGEDSLMGPARTGPETFARLGVTDALRTAYQADAGDDDKLARAMFTDRFMGGPARWVAARAAG